MSGKFGGQDANSYLTDKAEQFTEKALKMFRKMAAEDEETGPVPVPGDDAPLSEKLLFVLLGIDKYFKTNIILRPLEVICNCCANMKRKIIQMFCAGLHYNHRGLSKGSFLRSLAIHSPGW